MKNLLFILVLFLFSLNSYSASSTYIKGAELIKSIATTTTSGGSLFLNNTSAMVQNFTGASNHSVILPNANTIPAGSSYEIQNRSSGIIFVKDFSGNLLRSVGPLNSIVFYLNDALTWSYNSFIGPVFSGATVAPTYIDNGGGNITVNSINVNLFDNSAFIGGAKQYTLSALTATLTDGVNNYIVGDYNGGSPIMRITTDVNEITESNVVPLLTIYRGGTTLHSLDWDSLGLGLANKVHQSIVKTQRYRRESGLALSESGTRNVNVSAGVLWVGANKQNISSIASLTDNIIYFQRTAPSAWTTQIIQSYNNTEYFNGTTTVALSNNRYAVNWLYRGVESQKHLYMVLGEGDYTLAQAQASQPPSSLPPNITSHGLLVGRIIVLKGASVATQIDSAFNVVFTQSAASVHNDLSGLQGGTSGEYYHLTQSKFNAVENITASGTQTNFTGDIQSASCTYFGSSIVNGSFKTCQVGGALITSKLEAGIWVESHREE